MAYEDSVYTIVIAVTWWPKHTHLGAGVLWSFCRLPLLKCLLWLSLAVQLSRKSHEDSDYTAMITVMQWRLHVETLHGGEVMSAVTRSCFPSSSLNSSHGRHMACALVGMSHKLPSYNNTGSLWMRLGLSTSWWMKTESAQVSGVSVRVRPATRSAVATW